VATDLFLNTSNGCGTKTPPKNGSLGHFKSRKPRGKITANILRSNGISPSAEQWIDGLAKYRPLNGQLQ
jgi:hypothetical protein